MLASQGEARAYLLPGPLRGGYHACCPLPPVEHLEGARSSRGGLACATTVLGPRGLLVSDLEGLLHKHAQQLPPVCGHRQAPIPCYFFYISLLGMEL